MKDISCIILAGGTSNRMGEDKGLKLFKNQALVTYSIQLAKTICKTIYICTNNSDYEQFGYPILNDIFPEKGPMGGIYSGLKTSQTDWNLVLPCDTPFLEEEILIEMNRHLASHKVVVPITDNGRVHPLIGFYHKDLLPILQNHLSSDRLKILGLLNETTTYYHNLKPQDSHCLLNLNTAAELRDNEHK